MQKITIVLAVLAFSLFGAAGVASATGSHGGGTYPVTKPTVCASAWKVKWNAKFSVTAKDFCPNKSITITLSNSSNRYTRTATTNRYGSVTVWFDAAKIKPGTYTITARQNTTTCKKVAYSQITILKRKYGFAGDGSSGDGVAGDVAALMSDMQANEAAAAGALFEGDLPAGSPSELTSGGSTPSPVSLVQLALVALAGAIGTGAVSNVRRRSMRPASIA